MSKRQGALALELAPKRKAITKHEEPTRFASFENTNLGRAVCSAIATKQTKIRRARLLSVFSPTAQAVRLRSGPGESADRRRVRREPISSCLRRAASW